MDDDSLTDNDLRLLYAILSEHQLQAERDGIAQDHPSSVYRLALLEKLTRMIAAHGGSKG